MAWNADGTRLPYRMHSEYLHGLFLRNGLFEGRYRGRTAGAPYLDPDHWAAEAPRHDGSWWPTWQAWLAQHSSGREQPPAMGAPGRGYPPLEDAPGTYVLQR